MNSSSRDYFTAEELAALTPWRLPSVGEEDEKDVADGDESLSDISGEELRNLPRLTAEEIEAMQKQAYEEAAAQGHREGFAQGREEGYRAGHEQGKNEGFEQGRKEGLEQGEGTIRERIGILDRIVSTLDQPLLDLDEQVEQELTALAIALAKQLIRRELKTEPGQIIAVVRETLSLLPANSRKVSLYLHPDDAELVRSALTLDEHGQRWKLVDDPLLTRGGCRVSSENSAIDATVEKRLAAAIAHAFGGEREGDGA